MEQHPSKRYKGTQKEFGRWIASEFEDYFPEITTEDPLKKIESQLNNLPLPSTVSDSDISKPLKGVNPNRRIKRGVNFDICKYWKQLPKTFSQSLIRFMDLKDMISLMYTCKYFKELLDHGSTWRMLQTRDFPTETLKHLKGETKKEFSMKQYYRFLYLSQVSGIPNHTGYFKTYGSPDVAELAMTMVDFLCPKTEPIKEYIGEILSRNQCKTFDVKLSWLRETNEICLWNGNASVEFRKPEVGNEEVEQSNKFYPCFIKRYSLVDEDEEIVKVFFLEDKYLVVKLLRKDEEKMDRIFRILDLEEELYSMAKGLDSVAPFDYTFTSLNQGKATETARVDEFGVDFTIQQEGEFNIKVQLLQDHQAVFFTEHSGKPTLIFWNLKEKKQIGPIIRCQELKKPLYKILKSKKIESDKSLKVFILDEGMNIYCGYLSQEEGFILNQTIFIPKEEEEEDEEKQEKNIETDTDKVIEAQVSLNLGKKTRLRHYQRPDRRVSRYIWSNFLEYPAKNVNEVDQNFEASTRRYYHEMFERTCEGLKKKEEWLIVYQANHFYFANLDEGKIYEFSSDKEEVVSQLGNWTIYEDNLLITNPSNVLYYKLNFEDQTIRSVFSREIKTLQIENVVKQWIVMDPCFTTLIFTHSYHLGFASTVTVIVTSTQEFFCNQDKGFNSVLYKVQADRFLDVPDKWENKSRNADVNIKFESSKVFVSTKKAGFFFDMTLSSKPYSQVHLNGWTPKDGINIIRCAMPVKVEEPLPKEEEEKVNRVKCVNNMELKGNPNTANAKEKNNGWKKSGGKSQTKKEEDKEYKVLKGKGEKYHKNVRQNQRSDKMN